MDGKAAVRVDVDVRAGEMLFLPASWFHEVTSFSSAGGHIAFNYWMHPARHGAPFDAPYEDDFWARRYAQLSKAGAGAAKSAAQPAAVAGLGHVEQRDRVVVELLAARGAPPTATAFGPRLGRRLGLGLGRRLGRRLGLGL